MTKGSKCPVFESAILKTWKDKFFQGKKDTEDEAHTGNF